jgi:hypothetical protein
MITSRPAVLALICGLAITTSAAFAQTGRAASQTKKAAASSAAQSPGAQPLTLDQIRKLMGAAPDSVVAQEISDRGVKDDYTRQTVEQLRQQGAGQETIAALTRGLPFASLTVKTEPGATVRVDGGPPRTAGGDGVVSVTNLEPGSHEVAVVKPNFTPYSKTLELKGRDNAQVDAKLEWAVGFLTVTADEPSARIQVGTQPAQAGPINRMPVAVGPTTITVTAPLKIAPPRTVTIEPGKDIAVSFTMAMDPAALTAMANQIHSEFLAANYRGVQQTAARYFETGARDKNVLTDVAISDLETGATADFASFAREAVEAGATLRLSMMHHHGNGFVRGAFFLHPVAVEANTQGIRYEALADCNIKTFETAWNEVRIGPSAGSVIVNEPGGQRAVRSLNLKVPNPADPKKELNLNLTARDGNAAKLEAIRGFLAGLTK